MSALNPGTKAPQFELLTMTGLQFSLQDALTRGPLIAVFFKVSCPVCQYALPFYDRLCKAYGLDRPNIIAVSQNEKNDTADFVKKFGLTFPVLLEDTKRYAVSNAYGLTTVPTAFWISGDGEIEVTSVGWVRKDFEEIARKTAPVTTRPTQPIFQPNEQIPEFRAG
ncbi:MAG TPA: TlpA disulfide reductase family protein [Terriglobales bacterium]|jgi:peroxiredoxin